MKQQAGDRRDLQDGEIHVWLAHLGEDEDRTAEFACLLDRDEAAHAARFSYERLRTHFVQSHAIVRRILAEYAGVADPAELVFTRGRHGKPRLVAPAAAARLHFSLSHSGHCCILAVRLGQPLGIDLERRRDLPRAFDIARRNFTAGEGQMLASLRGSAQCDGFFKLWTRKEAVTKALGASLAASLKRIEFEFDATGRVRLAALDGDRSCARGWVVAGLDLGPQYVAALATARPCRVLQQLAWNEPAGRRATSTIEASSAAGASGRRAQF